MGGDAALWVDNEPGEPAYRQLIFDRERCEGEWEESKRIEGWSYWRSRNNPALRHPLLKPYKDLSDTDKELDLNAIREYPALARFIGYRIVRGRPADS
jgi:hypothetical protein